MYKEIGKYLKKLESLKKIGGYKTTKHSFKLLNEDFLKLFQKLEKLGYAELVQPMQDKKVYKFDSEYCDKERLDYLCNANYVKTFQNKTQKYTYNYKKYTKFRIKKIEDDKYILGIMKVEIKENGSDIPKPYVCYRINCKYPRIDLCLDRVSKEISLKYYNGDSSISPITFLNKLKIDLEDLYKERKKDIEKEKEKTKDYKYCQKTLDKLLKVL
jgi:hypothetical protein